MRYYTEQVIFTFLRSVVGQGRALRRARRPALREFNISEQRARGARADEASAPQKRCAIPATMSFSNSKFRAASYRAHVQALQASVHPPRPKSRQ